MSRRHRQLRVRDPDVFLFPPATPLAHRHARILRTIPVDHTISRFRYRLATRPARLGGVPRRKIIVNIATSADGYVARPDGNLDWLTERPAPKGFYGLPEFERSTDAKILGRKTFDRSLQMGARFSAAAVHYVFSRRPTPASVPAGVHFVTESIGGFAERLRKQAGKNVWMMGGGEIIGSFLDEDAIDEFIITAVPTFIGEGIPLIAPRHREVPLRLLTSQRLPDGVVQLHYEVQRSRV